MGRSYYVPRSAKGEGRILYIFTMKSFATTLVCGAIGAGIAFLIKTFVDMSIFGIIGFVIPFALVGFALGALTIPDIPLMGPLRKAGGENVLDILIRLVGFKNKKKLYIYGINREKYVLPKDDENKKNSNNLSKNFKFK